MHCDVENVIEYNLCPKCGILWRSINDKVIEESKVGSDDFRDFASFITGQPDTLPNDLPPEALEFLKEIDGYLDKVEAGHYGGGSNSMGSYIHKCLNCDSTAVDVSGQTHRCTECGFTWEVY
jgi:hypothetical protein